MEWLKAIRISQKILQEEVAARAQIRQPTYANIENGKRRPSVQTAQKIASVMNFDWRRFYE